MKKIVIGLLVVGIFIGLAGCSSNEEKREEAKKSSSIQQNTEETVDQEDQKMGKMETDLGEKGVEITSKNYLYLTREKSIDYDYFEMVFTINSKTNEVSDIGLKLKGNIDGEMKDDLSYDVSKGRMVEHTLFNTDITALAEVLKSLDYSDKEILEFVQWYYQKNK